MELNLNDLLIDVPGASKTMMGQVLFAIGFGGMLGIMTMRGGGYDLAWTMFFIVGTAGLILRTYGVAMVKKHMKGKKDETEEKEDLRN